MFGSQIREYAQKFENINRELARLQQEAARLTKQLGEQSSLIDKQVRDVDGRLVEQIQEQARLFTQQVQDTDKRLATQLNDLGNRLSDQIQELDKRYAQKVADLDVKYSERGDELQQVLRQSEDSVRAELRSNAEALGHSKVDREVLGDMLMQLATGLKEGHRHQHGDRLPR